MLGNLLSKPTLAVTLEQDMVHLRPSLDAGFPSDDPVVRGTVLLSLPAPRAIKSIKVVLEGISDVCGGTGWPYETTTALKKELDLEFADEVLKAGNHAFNFAFIIPSSTAVYQRSTYGRIRHYVKATIQCSSGIMSTFLSPPVALYLTANQTPLNEPPEPLEIAIEHFSEELGPIGVGISSPHFTVASLLSLRLSLLGPPTSLTIHSISCYITQTFALHYDDGRVFNPDARKYPLKAIAPNTVPAPSGVLAFGSSDAEHEKDKDPLRKLKKGEEYNYQRLMRVPDDDFVRPTTLTGTETKIRASHTLSVEIRYRKSPCDELKATTIRKPVTIGSSLFRDVLGRENTSAHHPFAFFQTIMNGALSNCVRFTTLFDSSTWNETLVSTEVTGSTAPDSNREPLKVTRVRTERRFHAPPSATSTFVGTGVAEYVFQYTAQAPDAEPFEVKAFYGGVIIISGVFRHADEIVEGEAVFNVVRGVYADTVAKADWELTPGVLRGKLAEKYESKGMGGYVSKGMKDAEAWIELVKKA
ncbi:hypothetical protein P7C70_g5733, partial [Phenoliferia sp. Uapishka_3]